jgi:hypothetical protein
LKSEKETYPMTRTFDPKCHELACHFLADTPHLDTPERRDELAVAIQEAVEDAFRAPTIAELEVLLKREPEEEVTILPSWTPGIGGWASKSNMRKNA